MTSNLDVLANLFRSRGFVVQMSHRKPSASSVFPLTASRGLLTLYIMPVSAEKVDLRGSIKPDLFQWMAKFSLAKVPFILLLFRTDGLAYPVHVESPKRLELLMTMMKSDYPQNLGPAMRPEDWVKSFVDWLEDDKEAVVEDSKSLPFVATHMATAEVGAESRPDKLD